MVAIRGYHEIKREIESRLQGASGIAFSEACDDFQTAINAYQQDSDVRALAAAKQTMEQRLHSMVAGTGLSDPDKVLRDLMDSMEMEFSARYSRGGRF